VTIFKEMEFIYALVSVIIVSLISVAVAIPFLLKKQIPKHALITLMSISVGTLLGAIFFHFLPETFSTTYTIKSALTIILGFLLMFIVEKFVHHHHHHGKKSVQGHSHGYALAPINLIGDAVHNFIDGLVIIGSYIISVPLGIAATISILLHELPQELADFGVLIYAGFSKRKAILFNLFSALAAVAGVIVGFFIDRSGFTAFIMPFAAGNLLYIAAANLTPELHQHCGVKESIIHTLAILFGVAIMLGLIFTGLGHAH
jgi:zinc and cadmium transporter